MLKFKHARLLALMLSLVALTSTAQAEGKRHPFSSKEGQDIYKKTDTVDGYNRTVTINASRCEKRSAAQYKPPSCPLSLYCDIKVHTHKVSKVAKGISLDNDLEIQNAVVTATCPRRKGQEGCPDEQKCLNDASTKLDSAMVLDIIEEEKAKPHPKKTVVE